MNVFINGKLFTIENVNEKNESIINQALQQFLDPEYQSTFAVALNSDYVGRGDYCKTVIKEGDSIDVLFPIVGG